MRTFCLKPIDGRKSFYGKCHVNEYVSDGIHYYDLISYGKRVAYYNQTEGWVYIHSVDSRTTKRHIDAFLDFIGVDCGGYNEGDYFDVKKNCNDTLLPAVFDFNERTLRFASCATLAKAMPLDQAIQIIKSDITGLPKTAVIDGELVVQYVR